MLRKLTDQKGIALMMVLSAVVLLSSIIVEFAFNTNIYYDMALNERDRLQAYYLAKSSYNFMLLELKFDKQFRKIVETQNLEQYLGDKSKLPLCQQFPLSTGLIRAVFTGGGIPGMTGGGEGAPAGEEGGETQEKIEDMRRDTSVSQEKNAAEFLEFEGDFDGECTDEGTKINLNGFYGLTRAPATEGGTSELDLYKRFLYEFLSREDFKPLFEAADVSPIDVVDNVADWVDSDGEVNKMGGRSGGAERSAYDRLQVPYQPRNGKLMTLEEANLIDGVLDDWFDQLKGNFTVYGDGKVNVCASTSEVVGALIRRYLSTNTIYADIRITEDQNTAMLKVVTDACAEGASGDELGTKIQTGIDRVLGVEPENQGQTGAQQAQAGQGQPTGAITFASFLTSEPRFYMLKLAGQVGDTVVRVNAVIDAKDTDMKKWKLLYWRVQ